MKEGLPKSPNNADTLREIGRLAREVYGNRKNARAFRRAPRKEDLDGRSPNQAIAEGDALLVRELLIKMTEGTYGN